MERVDVLGVGFNTVSLAETVQLIRASIRTGERLHIVTGNVDFVVKARRNPRFREDIQQADLVVADGVPILWAAAALGTPLRGRVNGIDLVQACAVVSADFDAPVALIGASPEVAKGAAEKLTTGAPGATVHAIPTPENPGVDEVARIVRAARELGASVALVAMGAPKQERWIMEHLDATGAVVGIGVGSAFDILSGERVRAPGWIRAHGFEWAFRMAQEPRRLGRRYIVEDSRFVAYLCAELISRLVKRRAGR